MMNILSPMATGNGAYVVHDMLSKFIDGYNLKGYDPRLTLFPPLLSLLNSRCKPDIIHTTPDYGTFFSRNKTPLVITFHNYILDSFMQPYSSLAQRIHYKTDLRYFTVKSLFEASIVNSVSQFTADLIKKEHNYQKEIRVIYNGIDHNLFHPATNKRKDQKTIKVLYSGNLSRRKGSNLLADIADKLDDGIEILYTQGLRTKNHLPPSSRLQNLGNVPYSAMPTIYQNADILLFPTVREGFGLAAAEAMACGLPVVATDCSSLPELIVNGKGGYLCELGNVQEFTDRINTLAASPALRREMGEYNRARVEKKFTLDRMAKQYKDLFEQVMS